MRGWIKRLEQRRGMDEDPELKAQRTEEERAEIRARFERIIVAREPLDMDPRRRKALEDLNESFRRRRERGA